MQRLEVSGAIRPLYGSLGVKGLTQEMFNFSRPPPEASEIQDGAHFTATQLVRPGIS